MTQQAFDAIAARYDEIWSESAVGRAQREAVWRVIDRLFPRGSRVLDVGCGTGVDAAHLAARGVRVHAVDPSPEMVRIASERDGVRAEVSSLEDLLLGGSFDGALLNFGVLNCVPDLGSAARKLGAVLKPDARLVICAMGRFCLRETVRYLLRLNFAKAFRRWKAGGVETSLGVRVYYPSIEQIARAFRPYFRLVEWRGIGVFVPPSYIKPVALPLLDRLDRLLAARPGFRALSDHRLLVFERNPRHAVSPGGILRSIAPERRAIYDRFAEDYLKIRKAEGRGSESPAYYLALPYDDLNGRLSGQWAIRGKTYRYFERQVLAPLERSAPKGLDILDLGAGTGWLSYRLSLRGHRPVAVDVLTDPLDGLGAARHYFDRVEFPLVEAEFDRLPFDPAQFDLAIFNASFHYSTGYQRTLREVMRCLRPGGRVVILDSPVYRKPEHGEQMVRERHEQFERTYGLRSDSIPSIEYLDEPKLDELARGLDLRWRVYKPWYGWQWVLRPWKARLAGRRPPSRFWILVGGT